MLLAAALVIFLQQHTGKHQLWPSTQRYCQKANGTQANQRNLRNFLAFSQMSIFISSHALVDLSNNIFFSLGVKLNFDIVCHDDIMKLYF